MTIKVGQITNLQVARYCAGMGVQMLGFTATPVHPSYISPETYLQIREWVTGPLMVLELFEGEEVQDIRGKIESYQPDLIECPLEILSFVSVNCRLPLLIRLQSLESPLTHGLSAIGDRVKFVVVNPPWPLHEKIQGCPTLIQVSNAEELDSYRESDVSISAAWNENEMDLYEALERLYNV